MGIYKELQKFCGSSVQNYIAASRTVQGYEDWKASDEEERQEVIRRWREVQPELAAEKERNTFHSPRSLLKHGHKSSFDDGKKKSDKRKSWSKKNRPGEGLFSKNSNNSMASTPTISAPATPTDSVTSPRSSLDMAAFEEAMQASGGFSSSNNH